MLTFPDSENPSDAAIQVKALLELMVDLTCRAKPGESIELSTEAASGLTYVLMLAVSQLEQLIAVIEHMEKEINKFLDEAGVSGPAVKGPLEGIDGRLGIVEKRLKEAEENIGGK